MSEEEISSFCSLLAENYKKIPFPWEMFLGFAQILIEQGEIKITVNHDTISQFCDLILIKKDESNPAFIPYPLKKTNLIFTILVEFEKNLKNNTTLEMWGTRWLDFLINSDRGMIYLSMLELSDRWERENEHLEKKWKQEIENFFTEKILEESDNPELRLTLGKNINLLGWLNESWVRENKDKIFPLEDSLKAWKNWKLAFSGYLYSRGQVIKPIFDWFCTKQDTSGRNHFERAIGETFDEPCEDSLVFHIWLRYLEDSDAQISPDSLIDKLIRDGRENRISQLIYLYYRQLEKMDENENLTKKLVPLWKSLLETLLNTDKKWSIPYLLMRLSQWVELVDKVDKDVFDLLKQSIPHFTSIEAEMFFSTLVKLSNISIDFLVELAKLCLTRIEYPELVEPYINKIDEKIQNSGNKQGVSNLRQVFNSKFSPHWKR